MIEQPAGRAVPLEHFIFGKFVEEGRTLGGYTVTAHSPGLSAEQASRLMSLANTGPHSSTGVDQLSSGLTFVEAVPGQFLAVHVYPARHKDRGTTYPDHHGVVLPADLVKSLRGNISGLLGPVFSRDRDERPVYRELTVLEPLLCPVPAPLTREDETARLARLFSLLGPAADIPSLLSALLAEGSLAIVDAPANSPESPARFQIVEGFQALLPASARHYLTFATEMFDTGDESRVRLKIMYRSPAAKVRPGEPRFQWGGGAHPEARTRHPYASLLEALWFQTGAAGPDSAGLAAYIEGAIEPRTAANVRAHPVPDALAVAARSATLAVSMGLRTATITQILDGLGEDHSLPPERRRMYRNELLTRAGDGKREAIVSRLLDPRYIPPDLDGWLPELPALFRSHVQTLLKAEGGREKLQDFLETACRRLKDSYEILASRISALAAACTIEEWARLAQGSPALMMVLAHLMLLLEQNDDGLRLLMAADLENRELAPALFEEIGPLVHGIVRTNDWMPGPANDLLARLWASRRWELGEEEFFFLLRESADPELKKKLLKRLFEEALAMEADDARAHLLRAVADCLWLEPDIE